MTKGLSLTDAIDRFSLFSLRGGFAGGCGVASAGQQSRNLLGISLLNTLKLS